MSGLTLSPALRAVPSVAARRMREPNRMVSMSFEWLRIGGTVAICSSLDCLIAIRMKRKACSTLRNPPSAIRSAIARSAF